MFFDGYLGYIDKDMVIHSIKAGNILKSRIIENDYFMRKDSLLHITLIKPRQIQPDAMKQIAVALSKDSRGPPITVYNGIGKIVEGDNSTYFLTVHNTSQEEMETSDYGCCK